MTTICTGWIERHPAPVVLKPEDGGQPGTSHGICPACEGALYAELDRREDIRDEAGRYLAPPQTTIAPRPAGPWDHNG